LCSDRECRRADRLNALPSKRGRFSHFSIGETAVAALEIAAERNWRLYARGVLRKDVSDAVEETNDREQCLDCGARGDGRSGFGEPSAWSGEADPEAVKKLKKLEEMLK